MLTSFGFGVQVRRLRHELSRFPVVLKTGGAGLQDCGEDPQSGFGP